MNAVPSPVRPAYQTAETPEEIQANLADIRSRIDAACARSGRDPAEFACCPSARPWDEPRIRMAYAAGCRLLGENKVQEAYAKWEAMADLDDLGWAVIGHLQTNKANRRPLRPGIPGRRTCAWPRLGYRRLQEEGRAFAAPFFVQVNTSGETSKFGLAPEQVLDFARALLRYGALRVRGLTTLALFSPG